MGVDDWWMGGVAGISMQACRVQEMNGRCGVQIRKWVGWVGGCGGKFGLFAGWLVAVVLVQVAASCFCAG